MKKMNYQRPKGTNDILPGASEKWQFIEETARLLFRDYQYQEIRTPIFEHYEVIARSVGDTTDIVSKEMYDFYDKGERHVTLRPEGTAPIVRSFVENKLYGPEYTKPYKMFYVGPMFRYERPQAGRLRQFHQIGVEAFGSANPAVDVESMAMALDFFKQLGIKHVSLVINSLGDKESRQAYRQALIDYLLPFEAELSQDSQRRLRENPLRVLDSKDPKDKKVVAQAPSILDYLNETSRAHFEAVKSMLASLSIPFVVDSNMVRGLDYYSHTIFEIMNDAKGLGTQTTICAGGRYDHLVEELGGPATPAFGFAMGIERVLLTLEAEEVIIPVIEELDAYVVGLGEATNMESLKLVQAIRGFGFSADRDFLNRKAKAQFKTANKLNAKLVFTLGEDELAQGQVKIKNMTSGHEQTYALADVYATFDEIYDEMTTIMFE
ncbi:histidyl-tRNA synthetase [Enterococcus canis]|uniref:Histidine--tRNA ligase n=2 Tax=Enterococcus canis TaxID=214095 RepID=A0A1L8REM1_9ENTE|nr:histidyl-tRNA synthetase [Enterococcus canis]